MPLNTPTATKSITLQEDKPSLRVKYSRQKRSGSFIRKFNFSKNVDHIVCGLLATQHARCHKEYYSPRGQAVSTSHLPLNMPAATKNITLQEDKPSLRVTFFLSLWIELRCCMHQDMISVAGGKILLAKMNWFFHATVQLFTRNFTHSLRPTCHSTCPLSQRVLPSKRPSRFYESRIAIGPLHDGHAFTT